MLSNKMDEIDQGLQNALLLSTPRRKLKPSGCGVQCSGETLYVDSVRGDGDCQFHSIAMIVNSTLSFDEQPFSVERLRGICKKYILENMSNETLTDVFDMYSVTQADLSWMVEMPPLTRKYRNRFRQYFADVVGDRYEFWGDEMTLNILGDHFKLHFIVVDGNCRPVFQSTWNKGDPAAFLHFNHSMDHYSPIFAFDKGQQSHQRYILNHNSDCVQFFQAKAPAPARIGREVLKSN